MSSDDQLKAEIARLQAAISQHKAQTQSTGPRPAAIDSSGSGEGTTSSSLPATVVPNLSTSSASGYVKRGNKLVRVCNDTDASLPSVSSLRPLSLRKPKRPLPSRHLKLINPQATVHEGSSSSRASPTKPQWVQRRTRHMQLINAKIASQLTPRPLLARRRRAREIAIGKAVFVLDRTGKKLRRKSSAQIKRRPERVPLCYHFQRGQCHKSQCPYIHVRMSPDAPICRPFVYEGYCTNGKDCEHRHVYECPEFAETGECQRPKCRLPHINRRKAPHSTNAPLSETDHLASPVDKRETSTHKSMPTPPRPQRYMEMASVEPDETSTANTSVPQTDVAAKQKSKATTFASDYDFIAFDD
ncbi:hypothetical protein H4R34_002066 [Dimargaris verticillata]|uniref:C3H1-type domain-containing protein n=1 Tax=Dimargaris verticillata TaxID=2761393 RepID=A0A9W8B2G9_9FUNG|nr:hypothetical protein H4R34_002066 [Dimargaris verticillata]